MKLKSKIFNSSWRLYRAIYIAYTPKFGETLTSKVDGNPELSPRRSEKCRDLTGDIPRSDKEKVHTFAKALDKLSHISNCNHKRTSGNWYHRYQYKFPSSSFDSKPYPISGGNNKLPSYGEIHSRKILKFGETLTSNVDGNPELSLEWPGKCRDLTGIKSERYLEDKVHTFAKALDKLNWWHIGSWLNRIRCSKKRNGQLSLFRIDMKGAVNA